MCKRSVWFEFCISDACVQSCTAYPVEQIHRVSVNDLFGLSFVLAMRVYEVALHIQVSRYTGCV